MPYLIAQPQRVQTTPYSVFENFLSAEECTALIHDYKKLVPEKALVGNNEKGVVDKKKRMSKVRWIQWGAENEWLFARLANAIFETNQKWFGFALSAFGEPLQLTHYKASKRAPGHYSWHEDQGEMGGFQNRKLSLVIQLSDGYSGGVFRMLHHEVPEQKKGTMIVFPSYKTHCVEPVSKGERWSLVGWVTGPPFV